MIVIPYITFAHVDDNVNENENYRNCEKCTAKQK